MQAGADRSHRTCVEAFGVSWNEIVQCVESDFATNQQLEYEKMSCKLSCQLILVDTFMLKNILF